MLHRLFLITIACLLAGFVLAAQSSTGQVLGPRGRVLINQGKAFVLVQDRQVFHAGDRFLLLPGSQVELDFPDGCRQLLQLPQMVLVAPEAACAAARKAAVLAVAGDTGPLPALERIGGQRWWASSYGLDHVEQEDYFDTFGP